MGDSVAIFFKGVGDWVVRRRRPLIWIGAVLTVLIAIPMILFALLPTILSSFAPKLDLNADLYTVNRPPALTFLDAQGKEIGRRGALTGEKLKLAEMPAYLPAAFIAMEDRRFYSHHGIDLRGLARAMWTNYRHGHVVAGGSTITQQTAKILFTSQERTMQRKWTELFEAAQLEKSLSKTQILELYLNRIYLGSGAYGVDGAAHVYFNKSAREVTLPEAAMLATLTRAPSVFSPRRDLEKAQDRAQIVLKQMVETGAITQAEANDARAHPAEISDRVAQDARNFFLDRAADEATRRTAGNAAASDIVVKTTLEAPIEAEARKATAKALRKSGRKLHVSEAAVVVMKPDGAVSALLGGSDYSESTFDRATQAHRQPGSAFKPFVYLAALEAGLTPWDQRDDEPVDINGWKPTNYGGRSYGTLTLAQALAHSVNTITANLAQEVGIGTIVDAAARCGISSALEKNASLALGTSEVTPLELTNAYATFASGGLAVTPYFVTEIDARNGQVLYRREKPAPQRVIAEKVDKDLVAMLYGVVTHGTGMSAALAEHEAAGKTGTTQDYRDAWFVGFTADYVASVWVGNDDNSPMKNVTGGTLPAGIWHDVMSVAEKDLKSTPLDKSSTQAPVTDTTDYGSGEAETASGGDDTVDEAPRDDESGNTETSQSADYPSDRRESRSRHHGGGFFNWLFGGDGEARTPPPPPPHSDDDGNGN